MNSLHHKLKEHIRMMKNQASNIKRDELIVNRKKKLVIDKVVKQNDERLKA